MEWSLGVEPWRGVLEWSESDFELLLTFLDRIWF